eukprot:scaffold64092_cov30-Tisochrysis_lutea.AAC.4
MVRWPAPPPPAPGDHYIPHSPPSPSSACVPGLRVGGGLGPSFPTYPFNGRGTWTYQDLPIS